MFTRKSDFLIIFYVVLALLIVPVQLVSITPANAATVVLLGSGPLPTERDKSRLEVQAFAKQVDPTRPPSVIVQQLAPELEVKPEFQLTAIFTRNKQHYAVVNGTVLKTGDALADMLVTEITPNNLILEDAQTAQQVKVLELHGAINVKKQVVK